ncbi:ABC transporter [Kouleothrix aurantiaca]|uniref:ABC transporter n=1 Tax=Kouleothrix aurantiaca TaxID=186479 RepID=A0A0P9DET0_9CHLR|nr:ABC transporter [Kouleothrix aurantiaca]
MEHLRHLLPFVARYRNRLLFGLLCAAGSALLTAIIPQILRTTVDNLNSRGVVAGDLLRAGGIMLALAFADSLCRYGQRQLVAGSAYGVEYDMRGALFRRLLTLDQGFYGQAHTGDLMTRVTNDLSAVRQFLGPGVNSLMTATLFIGIAGSLLFLTNGTLALIVLALLPIITILFVAIGGRMQRIFRGVQDQFGDLSTRAQENFSGIRTIKAYAQEDDEIRTFLAENERYRAQNVRYVLLSGLLWPALAVVMGLIGAIVLLVGGRFVANGTMSLGDLVLFNTYLALLSWPMVNLGWTVNLYQQASASMGRIAEVLNRRASIRTPDEAQPNVTIGGSIEFRDVGIRFDHTLTAEHQLATGGKAAPAAKERTQNWVLRHISFTVPAGSSLAIVGATGVGKTTLVNLLARVRDPDEGQVLIDGRDIRTLPLDDLRRAIGYVPQDTFLFSVPLRENVTFGRPDATQQEVDRAAEVARLSNDLSQFPNGLDTMIGERGVTLSGGQKQRPAIARAVLRDPAILVLDDALSSVDTHTAAQILAGLRDVMQERTSIIIAQRIATVKDADQVVVLHEGHIEEQGAHRALVQSGGRYAAMYRRELLEAELREE